LAGVLVAIVLKTIVEMEFCQVSENPTTGESSVISCHAFSSTTRLPILTTHDRWRDILSGVYQHDPGDQVLTRDGWRIRIEPDGRFIAIES
jgi:hypothetical protein